MKLIDIALLALVGVAVYFAARQLRRGRKNGCGGACASCARDCGMREGRAK